MTVQIPRKKTIQMLRSVKDDLGLNVPGVYRIPFKCGKVYVGQTERSIETRCKKHRRHIHLNQPDKSPMAEHSINTALHRLQQHHRFGQNVELYGSSCERGHWQQTEQQKIQQGGHLMLSCAWHLVINMLSNQEASLTQQGLDTNQQLPLASPQSWTWNSGRPISDTDWFSRYISPIMDYACQIWQSAAHTYTLINYKCCNPSVFALWLTYPVTLVTSKSTRIWDSILRGPHQSFETESFGLKLADTWNPLGQKLGRHLCQPRADWSHPWLTEEGWRSVGQSRLPLKRRSSCCSD
jgi:hypothetical protein